MTVARKVLDRRTIHYLRKHNAKPKSHTIQKLAKELGVYLPSPKELIERLKRKRIAYTRMSKEIFGNLNHTVSFINAHKYGHSLRFETYQKLLDYAHEKGVIRKKINLEEILEKAGL